MEQIGLCWNCRRALEKADYGRETLCLGCGKSTRVCRNCREYAPGRPNDCLEPMAFPVQEKQQPTMCEFFDPHPSPQGGSGSDAAQLINAAESLFK